MCWQSFLSIRVAHNPPLFSPFSKNTHYIAYETELAMLSRNVEEQYVRANPQRKVKDTLVFFVFLIMMASK